MAQFSSGGWSYPDCLVGIFLLICIILSSFFNPLVIYHNRKLSSLPKLMFAMLAAINTLLALLVGIPAAIRILIPEDSPYFTGDPEFTALITMMCGSVDKLPHLVWYHNATEGNKVMGVITWVLLPSPCFLTGLHTCVRFLQIRYPLRPLACRQVIGLLGAHTLFLLIFMCNFVLVWDVWWYAIGQTIWIAPYEAAKNGWVAPTFYTPCILIELLAVVASILTVYELYKRSKQNLRSTQTNSNRSTVKISLENALNVVCIITQLSVYHVVENCSADGGAWELLSFSTLLPVFCCVVEPAIYIALTTDCLKGLRMWGASQTAPQSTRSRKLPAKTSVVLTNECAGL